MKIEWRREGEININSIKIETELLSQMQRKLSGHCSQMKTKLHEIKVHENKEWEFKTEIENSRIHKWKLQSKLKYY